MYLQKCPEKRKDLDNFTLNPTKLEGRVQQLYRHSKTECIQNKLF